MRRAADNRSYVTSRRRLWQALAHDPEDATRGQRIVGVVLLLGLFVLASMAGR